MARILSFVLASLILSASALTTPNVVRNSGHMQLAARLAVRNPAPIAEPVVEPVDDLGVARLTRRTKRCSPQKPVASTSGGGAVNAAPAPSKQAPAPAAPAPAPPAPPANPPPAPANPPPAPAQTHASPTEQPAPAPTSSTAPPAQSGIPCGPMSLTGQMSGDGTYFAPGLGACGFTNSSSDAIVAVSWELYDTYPGYAGPGTNPNNNPVCGRRIRAEYQGNSVVVEVVDRCTGCVCGSLDFSPAAFTQLAPMSVGRIHGVTWTYI